MLVRHPVIKYDYLLYFERHPQRRYISDLITRIMISLLHMNNVHVFTVVHVN